MKRLIETKGSRSVYLGIFFASVSLGDRSNIPSNQASRCKRNHIETLSDRRNSFILFYTAATVVSFFFFVY